MLSKKEIIQLYTRHNRELFLYLTRLVSDPESAEDILHDTFERFIRYSSAHTVEISTVRAFLFKTAHNLAVNYLKSRNRKHKPLEETSESVPQSGTGTTFDKLSADELSVRIQRFLHEQDPAGRSIFILHKEHGKTYDEIADEIGISSRTVRRRMKAMSDLLAEELEKEGYL